MKKFIAMILCFALLFGLVACAKKAQDPQTTTEETEITEGETTTQSTEAVYSDALPVFKERDGKFIVSYDNEDSWQILNSSGNTCSFKVKNDALYVSFEGETGWQLLGSVEGVSGEKTVTPQFKAEKAVLYVSLDNSASWAELAKLQCEHNYESEKDSGINVLNDITVKHTCAICGHSYTETIPATKEIKVLALGNSFTVDAMEHLNGLLKNAGVEKFTIGNLYIGGCSIDRHWTNIWQNNASYTFFQITQDGVKSGSKYTVDNGLLFTDWDIITLQQASPKSTEAARFGDLQNVIDHVKEKAPQAEIWWHMTWSYPNGSSGLRDLELTQMEMYEDIVSVVNSTILTNPDIARVIPVGTTIQNLRTSKLGDTLNRDSLHLSEGTGRYAAAMTWLAALTGADVDKISWTPEAFPDTAANLSFVKEAVKNAMQTPYAVTQSAYPPANKG